MKSHKHKTMQIVVFKLGSIKSQGFV